MKNEIKIGTRVRFLNEVGGGIVSGFRQKGIVLVQDENGFEIPFYSSDLVIVDQDYTKIEEDTLTIEENALTKTDISPEKLNKEIAKKVEKDNEIHTLKKQKNYKNDNKKDVVIDLHASELLETTKGLLALEILELQVETFRKTLKQYENEPGKKLIFIHGKGEGILRQALLRELKRLYPHYDYQDASFKEYGYGATRITVRGAVRNQIGRQKERK